MSRLIGGLPLRVAAWIVAITVTVLLWMLTKRLDFAIYCWPSSPEASSWKLVRLFALAAMLPTLALPASATLSSERRSRQATLLAVATIVISPVSCIVLYRLAPAWPR